MDVLHTVSCKVFAIYSLRNFMHWLTGTVLRWRKAAGTGLVNRAVLPLHKIVTRVCDGL